MTRFRLPALLVACLVLCAAPGALAQTFSDSFAGFGSNSKEPIQIEAKELKVADKNQVAEFIGDVVVRQGDTTLKTQRLKIRYAGSAAEGPVQNRISRMEATGTVLISSKDQTATGDAASFDMDRQILVLTGKEVVLSQGPNIVVGSRLTINLESGKVDLEAPSSGRVKVLITPNSFKNSKPAGN